MPPVLVFSFRESPNKNKILTQTPKQDFSKRKGEEILIRFQHSMNKTFMLFTYLMFSVTLFTLSSSEGSIYSKCCHCFLS